MNLQIIKSEEEYNEFLNWVDTQFDLNIPLESKEGQELQIVLLLIKQYEDVHYQIPFPDPIEVVKLKMEDDFISFKLNKFIVMLHDYELISDDDYNKYIYGTTDQKKIGLTKIGLSVSLISRLEKDDQLKYLRFDSANNLIASKEFNQYKDNANDFYRFEIERFIN